MNDRRRWFFHSHPAPSRRSLQSISLIRADFYGRYVAVCMRSANSYRSADAKGERVYWQLAAHPVEERAALDEARAVFAARAAAFREQYREMYGALIEAFPLESMWR